MSDVPGTGLGLPIVQRAAELNGIVVTLDAGREGKGLAVTLLLGSGSPTP